MSDKKTTISVGVVLACLTGAIWWLFTAWPPYEIPLNIEEGAVVASEKIQLGEEMTSNISRFKEEFWKRKYEFLIVGVVSVGEPGFFGLEVASQSSYLFHEDLSLFHEVSKISFDPQTRKVIIVIGRDWFVFVLFLLIFAGVSVGVFVLIMRKKEAYDDEQKRKTQMEASQK